MDFTFSPAADEAAALAATICADLSDSARQKQLEDAGDRFDRGLWDALHEAGLLTLSVTEEQGGAGLGLIETCRVLVEAGRVVAPAPLFSHLAAQQLLAEAAASTPGAQAAWDQALAGRHVLGLVTTDADRLAPVRADASGRLTGRASVVLSGERAWRILVPAVTDNEVGLWLVDPSGPGVEVARQTLSGSEAAAALTLDCDAERLGGPEAAQRLRDLFTLFACAYQLGVTEGALAGTAGYAKTREQFGRAIGTFQAVAHRLADGHIDLLGQRLTLWQAAWRLDQGLPCSAELASAALWATEAGHRIAHTAVHIHGGVGIDLDGCNHRYFSAAKRLEFLLGGSTRHARIVGATLA